MKRNKSNVAFLILILVILALAVWVMSLPAGGKQPYVYSDIRDLFEAEQVKSFTLSDNALTLQLREPDQDGRTERTYKLASFSVFYNDFNDTVVDQYERGILEHYDYPAVSSAPWWLMFIPYILIALLFWACGCI